MAKKSSGTALIMVLLLTSLMGILGLLAISSCQWGNLLNHALYDQEKQFRYAHGLLDCAISKARGEFDAICKNKKIITSTFSGHSRQAQLIIEPRGTRIEVSCILQSTDSQPYTLKAELIKDSHSIVRVQGFQR